MNDRFQELTVFVRAADSGSFSAAARDLSLSQPSVSRIISELEGRLETKLFLRSTRRIVPTEAGIAFLQRARKILHDLEDADELARSTDSLQGVLRVALPAVLYLRVLLPELPAFLTAHPHLKMEFLTTDSMQDLVADGVDVAIRFGQMSDSGFGVRRLASLERILVAAPSYLRSRGTPGMPNDLYTHDLIAGPLNSSKWPWNFRQDGVTQALKVQPRFLFTSAEAATASACQGLGVARAAVIMCKEEIAAGHLVRVLPAYDLEPIDVSAVYPAGRVPSQKVREFTKFVSQLL